MPHIVHLTTVHLPFDTRIFQKECRTLAQSGYKVSLIATHPKIETVDGVEIVPLPRFRSRGFRILLSPWAAFRVARQLQADLYHFHDPELLLTGVLLKWTTKAKVIYDVHENHPKKIQARSWLPRPFKKIVSLILTIIERLSIKTFDAIVAVTEHIAARFPASKTIIVKNYPLLKMTENKTDGTQYETNNHTLIYTGGWTDHRGIYQVVQALEHVTTPDVKLILLGRVIDAHVQEKAKALPGYSKVEYLGLVPYKQLYSLLQTVAVGFVCNQAVHDYDLAQPNKLFEYMSTGLPIIASHFPLWQEIVEGNTCGLTVDSTKPKEIAKAVDYLLSNADLRKEMGENGYKAVNDIYNWGIEGEKLLDLYKGLL